MYEVLKSQNLLIIVKIKNILCDIIYIGTLYTVNVQFKSPLVYNRHNRLTLLMYPIHQNSWGRRL